MSSLTAGKPKDYSELARYNTDANRQQQQQQAAQQALQSTKGAYTPSYNYGTVTEPPIQQRPMAYGGQSYGNPGGYYAQPYQDLQQYLEVPGRVKQGGSVEGEDYAKSKISFGLVTFAANEAKPATETAENQQPVSLTGNYQEIAPYALTQGTLIPVTLLTGITSDSAGQVVSQVRENVYDSLTGYTLLIPQGARLIGTVSKESVGAGQERIGVAWQRLIMPDGATIDLGSMAGVDAGGYPGLKDQVNNHTGKIVGATLLTSILSAAAQIAAGNTDSSDDQSAGQLAVSGAATGIMNAGTKLLEKNININPTITIRPGMLFNVFVNQDIILRPYHG